MSDGTGADQRAAALSNGPLSFLPRAVREPLAPIRSALVAWPTATIPALLLGMLLATMAPDAQTPEFPVEGGTAIFLLVVFAPVFETLIMGTVLLLLLRFFSPTIAVFISAIGWGIVHSLEVPAWGLVIWWPFLIFSTVFVAWRQRSLLAAYGMAALVHGLNNLLPALPIAYPELFGG